MRIFVGDGMTCIGLVTGIDASIIDYDLQLGAHNLLNLQDDNTIIYSTYTTAIYTRGNTK